MSEKLDAEYVQSMEAWIASQKTVVEVIQNRVDFLIKDIEISNRQLKVFNDSLNIQSKQLETAQKELKDHIDKLMKE